MYVSTETCRRDFSKATILVAFRLHFGCIVCVARGVDALVAGGVLFYCTCYTLLVFSALLLLHCLECTASGVLPL